MAGHLGFLKLTSVSPESLTVRGWYGGLSFLPQLFVPLCQDGYLNHLEPGLGS